jgi:cytochrome c oxidase subunit 2
VRTGSRRRTTLARSARFARFGFVAASAIATAAAVAGCGADKGDLANLSPEATAGRQVAIAKGCLGCHSSDGSRRMGPTFKGAWMKPVQLDNGRTVVFDAAYLTESIRDPKAKVVAGWNPVMPPATLSDQEFNQLLAYIQALG